MLRVGLTGDLGSGKSTVTAMLAALGAVVLSSDEMGHRLMQPGQAVYQLIVDRFGQNIVAVDGSLDRRALAKLAFSDGRVEELNAIVHPAVLTEQARLLYELAATNPHAIAVVESALLFTTKHVPGSRSWRERFDRIILVQAPLELKLQRFVERVAAGRSLTLQERAEQEQEAHSRLALQSNINEGHVDECLVINNGGDLASLRAQVESVWAELLQAEAATG